jgi:glycyl-tRNA synthetase beta chain
VHLREEGVRHDLIFAVFDLGDEDDLVRLVARVTALQSFLATDGGGNLLTAYRRAANILRIEEKKDDRRYDGAIEVALLTEQAEKDLHTALESVGGVIGGLVSSGAFEEAMTHFASLRDPVDAFFETVTVNSENLDLRANRLKSLSSLVSVMNQVADFSKVEG